MSTTEPALSDLRERVLAAAHAGTALRLRGAGTKDFYGEAATGEVLDLRGHQGIVAYEPSELVITARCGTPLSQLAAALAEKNQFLAFEPPGFGGDPTLGGIVAAGLSGPRRAYAGAARDFVLGARLLGADGEYLRFGGEVMKNVAGFDVSRLLCGSLGILGIITEVSVKVLPRPRTEQTLRLGMTAAEAVESFNRWAAQPLPLSATAWCAGAAWVRLSGAAPAVEAACRHIGGERIEPGPADAWWVSLRDCQLPPFTRETVWRLSLPATASLPALPVPYLIDAGGAVRWYAAAPAETDFRSAATAAGGTAQCWRGAAPSGRFHPLPEVTLLLHRRLKAHFDPRGIFNPGRLVPGI
jgi:glycolate oxidase FAD binding subunit